MLLTTVVAYKKKTIQRNLYCYSDTPTQPEITLNPSDHVEGSTLTLTCHADTTSVPADDAPVMTYTWTRNGQQLPTDRHQASGDQLVISGVTRTDHGQSYECQARESETGPSNSNSVVLSVLCE